MRKITTRERLEAANHKVFQERATCVDQDNEVPLAMPINCAKYASVIVANCTKYKAGTPGGNIEMIAHNLLMAQLQSRRTFAQSLSADYHSSLITFITGT